jgi:hypothetical protein
MTTLVAGRVPDALERLEAVGSRHHHVEQYDIRLIALNFVECFFAIGSG